MQSLVVRLADSLERRLARAVFWLWVPVALLVGASLLATHWYKLPLPDRHDERLLASLAALRTTEEQQEWMVVHVMYASCKCSREVVRHLVEGPRPAGIAERVVLVGSAPEVDALLAASSFTVIRVSPRQLADRFAIEAAPLLLVVDPQGVLRYRGGYSERKQATDLRDVEIIVGLLADGEVPTLPLFGCAVSEQLRGLLDPFGLRRLDEQAP